MEQVIEKVEAAVVSLLTTKNTLETAKLFSEAGMNKAARIIAEKTIRDNWSREAAAKLLATVATTPDEVVHAANMAMRCRSTASGSKACYKLAAQLYAKAEHMRTEHAEPKPVVMRRKRTNEIEQMSEAFMKWYSQQKKGEFFSWIDAARAIGYPGNYDKFYHMRQSNRDINRLLAASHRGHARESLYQVC